MQLCPPLLSEEGQRDYRPLFKVILEILRDAFMQMNALVSTHIMRFARINEEVRLRAGGDAGLQERERGEGDGMVQIP